MNRFRELDRYPKILLLALVIMAAVFSAVYSLAAARAGYAYNGTLLVPRQTDGAILYEGRLDGYPCTFTVTQDTVTLVCGKTYGPYTLREDPSAIPDGDSFAPYMTGIVITDGAKNHFRGGMMESGDGFWLFSEDGTSQFTMSVTMSDGSVVDQYGQPIDPYAPTAHTVVELLRGPALTHRGHWSVLVMCILSSLLLAVSILFADDLFRFSLSFRIRGAEHAHPSDWELAGRVIGWTILTAAIFTAYLMGLHI